MKKVSASQFADALNRVGQGKGRIPAFLQAHYERPGRAATATILAGAVGYKSYDGINLQYGMLASKIGAHLGIRDVNIRLLVDLVPDHSVTNEQWIFIMRPEFARGLKRAGWVTGPS
ncbi:MAG: hypothetical protein P4L56_17700 [Candidatus Sulfopaludibacter sp.]|nr:hypothetical protein [Candidatus Sulfopaludibacter sp.]